MGKLPFRAFFVAIMIVAASSSATQADLTYSLVNDPLDQNLATLSGTITTDGTIGALTSLDIVSWSWTITPLGGSPYTLSSSDSLATVFMTEGVVYASNSEIYMQSHAGIPNPGWQLDFGIPEDTIFLDYDRGEQNDAYYGAIPNEVVWETVPIISPTQPWVVATAISSVPEPSSFAMLAAGILGLVIASRTCSAREQWSLMGSLSKSA